MRPTLLLLALTSPALAVHPPETTTLGAEPVQTYVFDLQQQLRWEREPAWQAFAAATGWEARFDGRTGTPHRMSGPGLDLGRTCKIGRAHV